MSGVADLVIVANRLPVDRVVDDAGNPSWTTSPGGLVTALKPVLQRNAGAWIGWPGGAEVIEPFETEGMSLIPMHLTTVEYVQFYEGFCNATLWPLYHDIAVRPEYHREWWDAYVEVNQRFADEAARVAAPGARVWVQDYQMQMVPAMLRELRPDLRIGFFMHIPFPSRELFAQLPWRRQLLQGLLGADLIGFQVPGGADNFRALVRERVGHPIHGERIMLSDGRVVRAAAYPISIDSAELDTMSRSVAVGARSAQLRHDLGDPRKVFLGVDRLDYTKGIHARLRAFAELIAEGEIPADQACFVQVATPTRERISEYQQSRNELEQLVGRVNGQLGGIGRPVIFYQHASFPRNELAALYRTADIMVVTPYRDGMNLVAKEYVACRHDNDGALVLSEFAGAARELRQAWLINPYDISGLKEALLAAWHAEPDEITRRMSALRETVMNNDVDAWARRFLSDLAPAS